MNERDAHSVNFSVRILQAIDLAILRRWDEAKNLLENIEDPVADRILLLVAGLEHRENAQTRAFAAIRHDIGNALAIAQANLEGISDGVLPPTPERLNGILSALGSAGRLLEDLRKTPST